MSTAGFHERIDRLEDQLTRVLSILKDPAPPEPLLDVHAVADRLNVFKRTVESLISSGEIKPIRIKGQRRFDLAAVFLSGDAVDVLRRRLEEGRDLVFPRVVDGSKVPSTISASGLHSFAIWRSCRRGRTFIPRGTRTHPATRAHVDADDDAVRAPGAEESERRRGNCPRLCRR